MTRRVVITGMGTVNSLSSELKSFWHGLCAGHSGVNLIEQFDTTAFKVKFGGEVKHFDPETLLEGKAARRLDRFAQFALVAARSAVTDSGLDFSKEDAFRCGVILGSGIGGLHEIEEQVVKLIEKGRINAKSMITKRYSLENSRQAVQDTADRTVITGVIEFA